MASDQGSNERKVAYDVDVGSLEGQGATPEVHTTLHRKLKNRHVAMIRYFPQLGSIPWLTFASSIGGVIGTGLFLGTATSLMNGGPVGILLGYIFIGTICFATMVSSCPHQFQTHIVSSLITALSG